MKRQQILWILTLCGIFLGGCQGRQAFAPSELDAAHQQAYNLLLNAHEFAGNPLSCMPEPKEGQAFALIRNHPRAKAVFQNLLDKASVPGQLYALCYFYTNDPTIFWKAAAKYRQVTQDVPFLDGDIVYHERVCDIVDASLRSDLGKQKPIRIEAGKIFGIWYDRQLLPGVPDIAGGWYPTWLWRVPTSEEREQAHTDMIMLYTGVQLPNTIDFKGTLGGRLFDEDDPHDSILFWLTCTADVRQKLLAKSTGKYPDVVKDIHVMGAEIDTGDPAKLKGYSLPPFKRSGNVYRVVFAFSEADSDVFLWAIKSDAVEGK